MNKLEIIILVLVFISTNTFSQRNSAKYSKEFNRFAAEVEAGIDSTRLVVFIGSSTINGWKNLPTVFPKSNVVNRGFGGSQLTDVIYYADKILYPLNPAQIVLYEGDNDLGANVSVEQLYFDLQVFVRTTELKFPKTEIVLLSVKYSPFRDKQRAKITRYNELMKKFAETKTNVKYIDIASITINKDGSYRRELFLEDNLHVNSRCYELYKEKIEPYLLQK